MSLFTMNVGVSLQVMMTTSLLRTVLSSPVEPVSRAVQQDYLHNFGLNAKLIQERIGDL
jgi:hypothetical protein